MGYIPDSQSLSLCMMTSFMRRRLLFRENSPLTHSSHLPTTRGCLMLLHANSIHSVPEFGQETKFTHMLCSAALSLLEVGEGRGGSRICKQLQCLGFQTHFSYGSSSESYFESNFLFLHFTTRFPCQWEGRLDL